ncbi:MAG: hypothetical protein KDA54_21645 [Phycisphaerales bacterium]|nr:hypothetical protein [Phycisphaerales bacterium]
MNSAYRSLQVLLWFISASHVALGAAIALSERLQGFMATLYGVTLEIEPQMQYMLRPLGAFMMALGVAAGAAALRPLRHQPIIWGFVGLFVVRVFQRIVFHDLIAERFGISSSKLITASAFFGILALLLILFLRLAVRADSAMHSNS